MYGKYVGIALLSLPVVAGEDPEAEFRLVSTAILDHILNEELVGVNVTEQARTNGFV